MKSILLTKSVAGCKLVWLLFLYLTFLKCVSLHFGHLLEKFTSFLFVFVEIFYFLIDCQTFLREIWNFDMVWSPVRSSKETPPAREQSDCLYLSAVRWRTCCRPSQTNAGCIDRRKSAKPSLQVAKAAKSRLAVRKKVLLQLSVSSSIMRNWNVKTCASGKRKYKLKWTHFMSGNFK